MISRTKYLVDDETVRRLFQDAGLGAAEAVTPLGAGSLTPFTAFGLAEKNMR